MNTDNPKLPELLNPLINRSRDIVIISHVNPDGDAIGSSLALFHYLKRKGKNVSVIVPNEYPDFLKWLPGNNNILVFSKNKSAAIKAIADARLMFIIDFNTPSRADKAEEYIRGSAAFKIMIDHHPEPEEFADVIISDIHSSSTAEMVFRVIESIGETGFIDEISATCFYTGIMTDTGSFNYNSSQPETYRVLSELLKRGIDKDYIYSMVYDNFSEHRLRLLGYCLDSKMVVLHRYKTAYMSLSLKDKKQYNYIRGDSEGFVNYPLSIKGVKFVAFFMENDDHVKISFRSKGNFDTNIFAAENFEGGGHLNASGGESKLSLSETISRFVSKLPEYIK